MPPDETVKLEINSEDMRVLAENERTNRKTSAFLISKQKLKKIIKWYHKKKKWFKWYKKEIPSTKR